MTARAASPERLRSARGRTRPPTFRWATSLFALTRRSRERPDDRTTTMSNEATPHPAVRQDAINAAARASAARGPRVRSSAARRAALGLAVAMLLAACERAPSDAPSSPSAGAPGVEPAHVSASPTGAEGAVASATPNADDRGAASASNGPTDAATRAASEAGTAPVAEAGSAAGEAPGAARASSSRPPKLGGLESLSSLRVEGTTTSNVPDTVVFVDALRPDEGTLRHDFGRVLEGAPNQHEFVLRNTTDEALAITRLNKTCKCTLGDLERVATDGARSPYAFGDSIAPGERVAVSTGLTTDQQEGRLAHSVTLLLSSGGATRLDLVADVVPFFTTEPARGLISIGNLRPNESRVGTLTLRTGDGRAVLLSVDPAEVPELLVPVLTPLEPDAAGRSSAWRLDVTVGPGLPERQERALGFHVYADVERPDADPAEAPRQRVFRQRIAVGASVLPPVRVQPSYATFGIFTPGTAVPVALELEVTDDHVCAQPPVVTVEFSATQVNTEALARHLTARVVTLDEGRNWRIELELSALPAELAGAFQGLVHVAIDHPLRSSIDIPFSGLCRVVTK